ncbi:unnamed protein product, partial [Symbiodinium sp. KB8]
SWPGATRVIAVSLMLAVRAYAACTRAVIEEAEWEDVVEGARLVVSGVPASKVSALYNTKDGQRLLTQSFSANGDAQAVLWVPKAASAALALELRELAPGKIVVVEAEDDEDGTLMDGDAQDSLEADGTDADVATDTMFEHHEEEDEEGAEEEDEEEEAEEEMHEEAESEQGEQEAVLPVEAAEEPASTPRAAKALEPAAGGQVEPARGLRGRLSRPTKKRQ